MSEAKVVYHGEDAMSRRWAVIDSDGTEVGRIALTIVAMRVLMKLRAKPK
jgi:ribosomal protein L13